MGVGVDQPWQQCRAVAVNGQIGVGAAGDDGSARLQPGGLGRSSAYQADDLISAAGPWQEVFVKLGGAVACMWGVWS